MTVPGHHTGIGLQASLPGLVHLQFLITVLHTISDQELEGVEGMEMRLGLRILFSYTTNSLPCVSLSVNNVNTN